MNAIPSKSTFLYEQVRQALLSGRYLPGQRIDPATLASEFHTSSTPVRFALYRLVGEGLLEDHARGGLHVPLPTEIVLRDLYDWIMRLLVMACDPGGAQPAKVEMKWALASPDADVAKRTWLLFDAIAHVTGHRSLSLAVKQANDRLSPIRQAKKGLIEHAFEELSQLNRHWQGHDMPAMKAALIDYHERRKQLVPNIVALLYEGIEALH